HYDPLIAKLTVWGENRPAAIQRMAAALRETVLLGVTYNGQFLQDVLAEPQFTAGDIYTTWVEEHFNGWQPPQCGLPPEVLVAAALAQFTPQSAASNEHDPYSPWRMPNGYRVGQ
ncbi:MAG TPA: 3-methylcrotonyl-CoA carboxylase, partial [Anaerolineaceae bacterium]|nr:3-methylcrotonyl-CoA carboxylase [Anaerolineaceae bacterium]